MELAAGTRLGPYEILEFIGAGAMGVVYRARDTRLVRDVAVKVLPPVFARDPDRLARFEREARAVAAINHPNIVSVHDIGIAEVGGADGESQRVSYLITELLDGDTLRSRLAQGPLSLRKSADAAMQIARGLTAAHDRGVVHRDLKPENIVLLRNGHVKILDFGLAKQSIAGAGSDEQQTVTSTEAGTVLGTVGYMAPEQVRGDVAGPRSDLFALGAVLYELATGRRAFHRETAAETMTAILREDPPEVTMGGIPASLARIIGHALEKDPNDRFQSARDFAFALQAFLDTATSGSSPSAAPVVETAARPRFRRRYVAIGALQLLGMLAVAAAVMTWWPRAQPAGPASAVIFSPAMPWRDPALASPSVSPDGTRIAFIAHSGSGDSIMIRPLDALQAQWLKGTDGVRPGSVFWSPDGRSLGFFAAGKLKTIELTTEKVEQIADAPSAYGGTWGGDGTILFSPDERSAIWRVSASGGEAKPVTTLNAAQHEEAHRWPQFLPDGRHFVFMPWSLGAVTRKIQLTTLDGAAPKALFESESAAVVAGRYFIYVRDLPARLLAQAFNPQTFELEGRPVPVVTDDNVDYFGPTGNPMMSASAGTLVYSTGKYRRYQLTWMNRVGRPIGTVGEPDVYYDPTLSPDGTMLAVERRDSDSNATDLWTVDLARAAFSRLTTSPGFEDVATWSPDGRRIAYAGDRSNSAVPSMFVKNANGTGAEETFVDGRTFPTDWSRDGKYVLYMTDGGATRSDVWVYDVLQKTAKPLFATSFNEVHARFSPDGNWIAYASDEGHDSQVYIRSFPDGTTKIQVSTAGGDEPQWRRDGNELFYLASDGTLVAVDVRHGSGGLALGTAQPLFATNTESKMAMRNTYSPSPDGQRFLLMSPVVPATSSPLVGVLNWAAGLARKQ
jgi:Tol biopolymer transport system component